MLIQKIFHANESVEATKEKLFNLWGYRRHLSGVERACIRHDGRSLWELELGNGVAVQVDLEYFEGESENEVLFQSVDGNIQMVGTLEFTEIRDQLTEISVVLDVEFNSPIARVVDRMTDGFNRFLDRQLHGIRTYLEATKVQTPESRGLALCP